MVSVFNNVVWVRSRYCVVLSLLRVTEIWGSLWYLRVYVDGLVAYGYQLVNFYFTFYLFIAFTYFIEISSIFYIAYLFIKYIFSYVFNLFIFYLINYYSIRVLYSVMLPQLVSMPTARCCQELYITITLYLYVILSSCRLFE